MTFFLTMGALPVACFSFFKDHADLPLGIISMVIACIGYWSSLVFYNSFLPEIAAPEDRDRVSAKGFAMGYIGSVILQMICFVFVFKPEILGGDKDCHHTIPGFFSPGWYLVVGLWQFSLRRLPKSIPAGEQNQKNIFTNGYKEFAKVWKQLLGLPVLKRFLFSFFFYNMGVQTVMLAATLYGKSELKIPTTNLIVSILIIQLIAIPGAFAISKLSSLIGNFKALICCVLVWIGLCIAGYIFLQKAFINSIHWQLW